jgi:RNA recognition motif-containing protein
MNIEKKYEQTSNKYQVFIGGISPHMNQAELNEFFSDKGPIESLTLKMRPKPPVLNLGYCILATYSRKFFDMLIQTKFMTINGCKIEMKKYQDPRLTRKTNIITTLSEKIILLGVVDGMTESHVSQAIKKCDSRI